MLLANMLLFITAINSTLLKVTKTHSAARSRRPPVTQTALLQRVPVRVTRVFSPHPRFTATDPFQEEIRAGPRSSLDNSRFVRQTPCGYPLRTSHAIREQTPCGYLLRNSRNTGRESVNAPDRHCYVCRVSSRWWSVERRVSIATKGLYLQRGEEEGSEPLKTWGEDETA